MITVVNDELLVVRLSGIFNADSLRTLALQLNEIEKARPYPKRIAYVDNVTSVDIHLDDVILYKSSRTDLTAPVQTAFCAFDDFQYGISRMFQTVLESEKHIVEIFRDLESAARWLHVDSSLFPTI